MGKLTVKRTIEAPVEIVFRAVTDVEILPEVVPDVLRTEFLSETRSGVGTRFRETRKMGSKEHVTELDVTEYVEHEHVRMVADSHGTIWDTSFGFRPAGEGGGHTEISITLDARAKSFLPAVMNFLFKGLYKKGSAKHFDAVKEYCEKRARE